MRTGSCFVLAAAWLLLLALLAPCFADCPHSCSGHGDCHHDECRCNDGWGGDDCSVADTALESGETYTDSLNTFTWHYYHVQVPFGTNALNITVQQTSQYGDVDVYVQRGHFPTQRDNIAADETTSNYISIEVPNPSPSTYYIGLYGYWHVDYTLRVDVINGCAANCGAHGQCEAGECVCMDSWTGEHCDRYDRLLVVGDTVHDHVENQEWKYYHLIVPADNVLSITLTGEGEGDVDLYLKHEEYPTFFNFDYLNGTIAPLSTLVVEDPAPGTWYIGCYGYRGDSYDLLVNLEHEAECVAQCSGPSHGTCGSHGTCQCQTGFTGSSCETMTAGMELDTWYEGHVDQNTWNFYKFSVSSTNDVVIAVDQEESREDCDVFVKEGSQPTRISYDYAELSYREQFNITIEDPSGSEWHVGVYGWTACSYRLAITIPIECQCVGNHGQCRQGSDVCICNPGWTGPHCDENSMMIDNGSVYRDQTVAQYQWAYYTITTESTMLLVSMKEQETRGFLWLYVSQSGFPGLDTFDAADKETNTDFHEVHLLFDHKERRRFYIGVYGNPFDILGADPVPFSITAWSPPL